MSTRTVFVTTPGFEGPLLEELGSPAREIEGDGHGITVLTIADKTVASPLPLPLPRVDPVFARQRLPAAVALRAPSVATLADAIYDSIAPALDEAMERPGTFTLHAFAPVGADPGLGSRAELVGREVGVRLRDRRRRAWRRFVDPASASRTFAEVRLLVQVLLMERDRAWISAASPLALAFGGWDVAPWPAGLVDIAEDRVPPSRAYRKLEEAFSWMADEPRRHELCVDLGAAPGGWTYTALKRGARVVAVDRAALEAPLRNHRLLRTVEGNAFTFEPTSLKIDRADWLLSDVICEPARALALIERWLSMGWCRKLVVTIKFKGNAGYGILADVRSALIGTGCTRLRIKHLQHNKNEVTVMAVAPDAPALQSVKAS